MKLLLVANDVTLRESLVEALRQAGYVVELVTTFAQACKAIHHQYNCVLIDLPLLGGSEVDLVRAIKSNDSHVNVLLFAPRPINEDGGLHLGLEDGNYLAKPFQTLALTVRLKALIQQQVQEQHRIVFRSLAVWPENKEVIVGGKALTLTRKEYLLLLYLLNNPGRVLLKESIALQLGDEELDAAVLYTHVKNLRRKLKGCGAEDYIQTVYGMGYKLNAG